MRVKSPREYGLPPKFDRWRPKQEDALGFLAASKKRCRVLCAPTGSGKSALLVADALASCEPSCIVVSSRGLQDQYNGEFNSVGMADLRGKRNYPCEMRDDYSCEEGHAGRCPYKGTVNCPRSQAEMRAATSRLVVTNYSMWTTAKKATNGLSHIKRVYFDEGHEAPDALAAAMQVTLHYKEVEETLGVHFPVGAYANDMAEWAAWAKMAKSTAEAEMQQAYRKITEGPNPKPTWVKHFTHMRNLTRRLAILALARPMDWVVEELDEGYQFDPIRLGRYLEAALLFRIPSVTFGSATIRPKTMFIMSIGQKDFDFVELDSDFDPKRCPIYYVPTMRVDSRAEDLKPLWVRLDQIASRRRDRKGIIQTVSFTRQEDVYANSRFAGSMFLNQKGEAPTEMIEAYRAADDGALLVSPSVGTGYNFPMRDCEWQFLCKIPFEPPSKILKAREAEDKEYRYYRAMNKMVQIFGRGMRSHEDRCESFIGDSHLEWFPGRYGHLAPKSFHGVFRTVNVLPPPPPRLEL